jgi:hypothetical protein
MFDRTFERVGTWMGRVFTAVLSFGMRDGSPRSAEQGKQAGPSAKHPAPAAAGADQGDWARTLEHREHPEAQPNPGDPGVAMPEPEGLLSPQQEPSIPRRDEVPRGL